MWQTFKRFALRIAAGVFYTPDLGDVADVPVWSAINTGLAALDVRQAAWDCDEPLQYEYLILETSRDIYRRVNGGDWAVSLSDADARELLGWVGADDHLQWIAANRSVAGEVYAMFSGGIAGSGNAVLVSVDYGATWSVGWSYASTFTRISSNIVADSPYLWWPYNAGVVAKTHMRLGFHCLHLLAINKRREYR